VRETPHGSSFPGVRPFDCLKGKTFVTSIVIAMVIILGLAAGVMGMVAIGMRGRGRDHAPWLASAMSRAARHLNGDGEPPTRLVKHFR
jgi:hypothetical protein